MTTNYELYFARNHYSPIPCVQGDSGRVIAFHSADYDIPAGATGVAYALLPTLGAVEITATVVPSTDTVTVDISDAIAEPGECLLQIKITSDNTTVTSFPVTLTVYPFVGEVDE